MILINNAGVCTHRYGTAGDGGVDKEYAFEVSTLYYVVLQCNITEVWPFCCLLTFHLVNFCICC